MPPNQLRLGPTSGNSGPIVLDKLLKPDQALIEARLCPLYSGLVLFQPKSGSQITVFLGPELGAKWRKISFLLQW